MSITDVQLNRMGVIPTTYPTSIKAKRGMRKLKAEMSTHQRWTYRLSVDIWTLRDAKYALNVRKEYII